MSQEGRGIASRQGKIVFVSGALTGEQVRVQLAAASLATLLVCVAAVLPVTSVVRYTRRTLRKLGTGGERVAQRVQSPAAT